MGVLSTVATVVGVAGVGLYVAGRQGVVNFARLAGSTLGSSVSRARRARGQLQKQLTDVQTPEQEAMAARLQKNMWRARMIANEVTMVRNLSPRLLHRGNYGFTSEEVLDALAEAVSGTATSRQQSVARSAQLEAHAERQLEMEGQALADPAMYPLSGRHGSVSDTPIVPGLGGASSAPGSLATEATGGASTPSSPDAAPVGVSPGANAPVEALSPDLQRFHWSNMGEDLDPETGFVRTPSDMARVRAAGGSDERR
ncbi:hypothetical protein FNF29_03069 [Cafeteria roenbergensis]|uniref:Uncharacterized protein n=2 Tax=Cafeteria roenbergensis TaxID=33653 RepID=A0A5A8CPI3_CAFRO|nr:hypothetical protein FNF29_03069 [Cafeteria roenbergensis]|eukprot:KAA0153681.1 hypothetical protein FNF29_03069 [Cafeteria roenbergensis]